MGKLPLSHADAGHAEDDADYYGEYYHAEDDDVAGHAEDDYGDDKKNGGCDNT